MHTYQIRPRKDHRGVDLISDTLPFGRLWYAEPDVISNAIGYAMHGSRSHDAVIRVYDAAGNVIEAHDTLATSKNGSFTNCSPLPVVQLCSLQAVRSLSGFALLVLSQL